MLWVLKRTVLMRRFLSIQNTIRNFMLTISVYLDIYVTVRTSCQMELKVYHILQDCSKIGMISVRF